jgi:hypothetical protein
MASSAKLRYDRSIAVGSREDRGSGRIAQGMFAMTLPPPRVAAGADRGSRIAGLALLVLVTVAATRPAAAQSGDPYTATVAVDAASDTVAKARDLARIDGQRRALAAVVDRLAGGTGKSKPLKLGDNAVTDLVASFEVANERMSAVRYMADYTFHFREAELTKALQSAGIALASPAGDAGAPADANPDAKPTVLLPVYQTGAQAVLWDDPNPWRDAWAERSAGAGAPRLLVPLGDVDDVNAIDGERARAGDAAALKAIAAKYGADEVLVAVAVARPAGAKPTGLDVTARRYRLGRSVDLHADSIDAADDLYRRAADTIAADIATGWKNAKPAGGDQQASLTAVAAISGLDDWVKLRDRLVTVPSIRKVELKSLSRQEAALEIQYVGDVDHLKASLAAINLDLIRGDPAWQLARTGPDRP